MTDSGELGSTFDAIQKLVHGTTQERPQIDYYDLTVQLADEAPDERQRGWARYFLEQVHAQMEEDARNPGSPPTVNAHYIAQRFQTEVPEKGWQFCYIPRTVKRMIGILEQSKKLNIERADGQFPLYEETIKHREMQIQKYEAMRLLLIQAENLLDTTIIDS